MPRESRLLNKSEVAAQIGQQLDHLYADRIKLAQRIHPRYAELLTEMRSFLMRGGKRIRPYLTYLAYRGAGGLDNDAIIKLAASQELYHSFLLMHDDVIDQDTRRWDGPNLTGIYMEKLSAGEDTRRYAEAMAIMGGDINAALATDTIAGSNFPADRKLLAVQRMGQMIFDTVGGEVLDILAPITDQLELTEAELLTICRYKTARYSFEAPLHLGAIMAYADQATLDSLTKYALAIGVAFQLTDDLLGVYGDPNKTGKAVLSDMREGKQTLLIHHGLKLADAKTKAELTKNWGNPTAGEPELKVVQLALKQSGATSHIVELSRDFAQQAVAALQGIALSDEAVTILRGLATSIVQRQR